ncbi:MAG: glycoside hydrolase family 43 protein [Actinomycetota bacterium]|nr:glycoside hydrolase family 43 protein [Actinomycetota bacterium]
MVASQLVAAVVAVLIGAAVPVPSKSASPAYGGDFPDPYVLSAGGRYWAYSTGGGGRNLQVMNSADLQNWGAVSDPLPVLPAWAQSGSTWAPGVLANAGRYVMYYSARNAAAGRQCISVATSAAPGGPFADNSTTPFICQLDHFGSIDPFPFTAPSGGRFLLWKSEDNAVGQPSQLWGQRLSTDGLSLVGSPSRLLTESSPWQAPVIEGPSMVARGGVFYLFYGAGDWSTAKASMGYATCATPLGQCRNISTVGPWIASHGAALGPSGPAMFIGRDGLTRIAYHAWTPVAGYPNGGVRSMWVDTISFSHR